MVRQGPYVRRQHGCEVIQGRVNVTAGGISSPMVVGKSRIDG